MSNYRKQVINLQLLTSDKVGQDQICHLSGSMQLIKSTWDQSTLLIHAATNLLKLSPIVNIQPIDSDVKSVNF